jgi:hypothetical protein
LLLVAVGPVVVVGGLDLLLFVCEREARDKCRSKFLQDHFCSSRSSHRKGCRKCLGWMCQSSLRTCSRRPFCLSLMVVDYGL